jgi:DNA polymerase III subunit delta'
MSLSEGFDSDKAINFLKISYKAKKLSLAYLFVGEAKLDKKKTALKLAQILNCGESFNSDCSCRRCKAIEALGGHPDIMHLSPSGKGPSIGIDQIRSLIKRISLRPYELKKKVFIIYEADRMTEEAQNAFLKTLEEPPSDSILILISPSTKGLLDTITSRCQIIKFKRKEEIDEDLRKKEIISRFLSDEDIEKFFSVESRKKFSYQLGALVTLYRDILVLKTSSDPTLLINRDREKEISLQAEDYSSDDLYEIIHFLNNMQQNANLNLNLKSCIANTIFYLFKN